MIRQYGESGILLMTLKESGICNQQRGIQNPRLSWITLHGAIVSLPVVDPGEGFRGRVQGVRTPHIRPDACLRLKFSHQQDRTLLLTR